MTAVFAAAPVGGLSPLELFELLVAACFCTAVATWAGTAWWMNRRWEAEVAAEWADGMDEPVVDPEPEEPYRPLATGGVVRNDRLYPIGDGGCVLPLDVFHGIHSELPRPPIRITGVRDLAAQDRELAEVFGLHDRRRID